MKKPLTQEQLAELGREIDELKRKTKDTIGERDARYIKNIQRAVRYTGVLGRGFLFLSFFPPCWLLGVLFLSLSKILDNMELGHNVIHGQYDFMGDRHLNGKKYEWDILGTSNNWRESHNYNHHTYTNIEGHDEDIGYKYIRIFAEQKWNPWFLLQPIYTFVFAFFFQWGVALQNVNFDAQKGKPYFKTLLNENAEAWHKIKWQLIKDYLVFPLLAGPMFFAVFTGNMVANVIRSLWTFIIIFCGHFTDKVQVFPESAVHEDSAGQWYRRQILGSSNISGGRLFHIMSGNLSHQIEHHLFPDIPANRYAELAPEVEKICKKYGLTYNTGRLSKQFSEVIYRILRHSFPSKPSSAIQA